MSLPTLLDIAKRNGTDTPVYGLIDESTKTHPELRMGAARTIKGQNYKTLVRTALGNTGGSFRNANEGVTPHKHTYEQRLIEVYTLEPRFECDKAVADKSEDGWKNYLADEAIGTMEGEMQALASCFYYGTGFNSKAFPGLVQVYDSTNMVVDAGGTTASTGSSVWLVRFGQRDVQWVWGVDGQLELSDVRVETLLDAADSTKKFTGYVQTMLAYPGLAVHSRFSACRIKKLTADNGCGLTDARIFEALAKFPAGLGPDAIFASRRSLEQLRKSRTATNTTGEPAPTPTSVAGIPIYATEAISDTEALTL